MEKKGCFLTSSPLFFLFFLWATMAQTLVTSLSPDGQALLSLLAAADPSSKSSSAVLSSWNPSSSTPCAWQGITCSPQDRVISLSLPNTFLNLSSLPSQLSSLSFLQLLNLSSTNVSGTIPPSFGLLSHLRLLDLSSNSLSDNLLNGSIPFHLGSLVSLQQFRIGGNPYLTGEIPPQLGLLTNLTTNLYLHMNKLTGSIPPQLGRLQKLTSLLLWGNSLTGPIPPDLSNCSSLVILDASANELSGEIPGDLGKLVVLEQLHLSDNSLTGLIPWQLSNCTSLTALQLDKNQLSGPIPWQIFGLKKLSKLLLLGNSLSGRLPRSIGQLQNLLLDVHNNYITGEIPSQLGELVNLEQLDLSRNSFTGGIPWSFGNFSYLNKLILNNNLLTGLSELPETILTSLNISYNNFSGPIPSMDGNHKYMVEKSSGTSASSSGAEDFSYPWTFIPFQKLNFTIDNILDCLKDENVIGKGCSGVVYKAEMPNGELIAVKKLWKTMKDEDPVDSFASEIQILGHIRHRNIVKLLGYCSNKCVKLLLYNYISNGNLQQLLQGNRNLDWETRYKIAVGSAQGLAYLHHDCLPTILHRDVKCNNILLDSKYEAYLADFGLAKMMISPNYHQAISRSQTSFILIAEYGYTMNITEKSDVYSYGVVLLEILSGRSAVEPQAGGGLHIVEWVKKKMGSFEPAASVLDSKLQGLPDQMIQEMLQTLGIAMFCVNSSPVERPTMKEVVALLMEVKSPPEEWGKTSQPLIKGSSNQS
ncbi:unnamed protein product, partial [Vitis vinifera]